jgi:hypothetical protein
MAAAKIQQRKTWNDKSKVFPDARSGFDGRVGHRHPGSPGGVGACSTSKFMKNKILAVAFLSLVTFAVGCNQERTTSQQLDEMKTKTQEAAQDMRDYTFTQKDEFSAAMKSKLAQINRDLDALSTKIEASGNAAKAEGKLKLEALREQASHLNKQLVEVENSNESTWESVKTGSKNAYDSLKDGFHQTRQWVSDKIAP